MATEEVDFIDEEIEELFTDIEDKLARAAKLRDLVAKNEVPQPRGPCCLTHTNPERPSPLATLARTDPFFHACSG
jgi:hypothetical protein